ncbi:MAG: RNA polymerase sigma-70 factor (ECF subfamily) [Myxococcota bacterium]|jgi:RNA polymerase sigma-70 factor (ECF subfamily)
MAALIAILRDFELAEDALQEASARALTAWVEGGIPSRPAAWILTAARRQAIDVLRRSSRFAKRRDALETLARLKAEEQRELGESDDVVPDERLRLIFTCCHPALGQQVQVALTLRTLCGLTTQEIARAFLTQDATMAQRLVRAKRKIHAAGIPYVVPGAAHLAERLDAVLAVVYLVFNEGYQASSGASLTRQSLCGEAIRLGRILDALLPNQPEVLGLLALMLLHDARRQSRTDAVGALISLEYQDRASWDAGAISEGATMVETALRAGRVGPYQLQAAIAALHATAPVAEATDWAQIVGLYTLLARIDGSPVVALNRAAALAMADGPDAGLTEIARIEASGLLEGYSLLPAARADLERRAGRLDAAVPAYKQALAWATNEAERRFYERRLVELGRMLAR